MTGSGSEFPDTRMSLLVDLQAEADQDAWEEFVTIYRPVLYRLARKRGLQDADAQDLSQQILLSIAGSVARWEPHDESTRFRHWLRRVARNAISNAITRRPRDLAAGGTSMQAVLEGHADEDYELQREIELEHRRELYLMAASIVKKDVTAESWQIFELAVIKGVPIEEVARKTNKSVGAAYAARGRVMNRLSRIVAEAKLREL
ncbi:MAG: RNA polymerase sigma factor [Aureliella sp.]